MAAELAEIQAQEQLVAYELWSFPILLPDTTDSNQYRLGWFAFGSTEFQFNIFFANSLE